MYDSKRKFSSQPSLKRFHAIFVCAMAIAAQAEDRPTFKTIERDPVSIADFEQIVREAASEGAVRIRFPSGEWNWHCLGNLNLANKEKFSEWSSNQHHDVKESLEEWLAANEVAAVHISMTLDLDLKTYFQVERILERVIDL